MFSSLIHYHWVMITTDEVIVDDVTIVRMTNVVQLYIYKFYKTIGSNYLS